MENINGKSRASFRWVLSCAIMGLAVSVSLCFAQENRSAPQDVQRLQGALRRAEEARRLELKCDSLVPEICFDIYRRSRERTPERILDGEEAKGQR
jgi:hypothetical protein